LERHGTDIPFLDSGTDIPFLDSGTEKWCNANFLDDSNLYF
jgi:hypothetical protein